ncbi:MULTISPECIES: TlpA family protein disulfide reductase [Pseudoalteromonas]|uniref:Redoxin domain-containing protein n=1 Tax=Pseudoalteromonas obscura TaxID=3048491 RepID=A0ABT7ERP9_9GAMM|nr:MULTISPECIES: TlpA family protein disulfide reductase [Pseudoalteromonas]MBQ4838956.1 redoxin domain-containing protein [Pseudoalteromonas luteoviolacea]MDK2597693.1 redoxin domain-containing protein [Pseudoalteromonas sp. P94(2023)]
MIKSQLTISFLAAACLTISACGTTESTAPNPDYETYISPGDIFKHLTFKDIHGQPIDLANAPGKKLVIFFATWCSDSQRMFNALNASPLVTDHNLTIVAIGREETSESLAQFAVDYNVSFPLITDEQRNVYSQYANKGVPRLILLDENNRVVNTLIGETENIIEQVKWN